MNDILPFLDKRVATLLDLKRKIESEGYRKTQIGKVITISREFGCEAYPVANSLKAKLDDLTGRTWTIFTEEVIDQTSSDSVLSANLPEDFGEQNRYLEAIVAALTLNWKTERDRYREVVKTIVAIAHRGHAILVGRGASTITRELPNCFHFRLIGGLEFRANSYAKRQNISIEQAEKIVTEKEKARKEFLDRFLGVHFNIHNFHLIFNNEKVPVDQIVDSIISFVYELR